MVGARVQLELRVDKKFVEDVMDESPYKTKMNREFKGAIKYFECGKVVTTTLTDSNGVFKLPSPDAGKYCLRITPRQLLNVRDKSRWEITEKLFPVDVVPPSSRLQNDRLIADLSPLQTDCSGGGELVVVSASQSEK